MEYDLSDLKDDELEALERAFAKRREGAHPDERQDQAMLQPIVEALQYLEAKIDATIEKQNRLEEFLDKELIGSLREIYNTNERSKGVEGLRSKFGADFAPHEGFLKASYGDGDIFEQLFDHLKKHWDDEDFDPDDEMDSILEELEDKISDLRNALDEKKEEKGGEVDEGEEEPEDFTDEIRLLKRMPGMRSAAGE